MQAPDGYAATLRPERFLRHVRRASVRHRTGDPGESSERVARSDDLIALFLVGETALRRGRGDDVVAAIR